MVWMGRAGRPGGKAVMKDDNQPAPPLHGHGQPPPAYPPGPPPPQPPGYGYQQAPPPGYGYQPYPPPQKPRRRRRIFPWFFLGVQAVFLIWIIAGAQANHCNAQGSASANGACSAGTAIGVGLIIGLWVAADVVLGISYLVFRLSTRNR